MKLSGIVWILVVVFFGLSLFLGVVVAEPTGPSGAITPLSSSRYQASNAQTHNAFAGNVTEFNLNANAVTQTWQGYFGNITGRIVLGDSNNNTFYDWVLASPQGEIYATRTASVPVWADVRCSNVTEIATEDAAIGVNQTRDADSINNTFSAQVHNEFYVGGVQIAQDSCYSTNLYNSTGAQSLYFEELLLSDDASHGVIYTGLIDNNVLGFDGRTHDFQIMVGEDGHDGDTGTTQYYFYLELE